jgi:hypothetical protein
VTLRRGPIAALGAGEIAGRVVLANVPLPAHTSLLARIVAAPAAAVLSGLRPHEAAGVIDAWRALGLEVAARRERGGFCAVRMEAA